MATLSDVKAFIKTLNNLDSQELEAKVATEFSMSRDETKQLLRDIESEESEESEENDTPATMPSFVPSAIVAIGLAGAGVDGLSQNVALVAAMNDQVTNEPSKK